MDASVNFNMLMELLLKEVGLDKRGVSVSSNQLIQLWQGAPELLLPTIQALYAEGYIKVNEGVAIRSGKTRDAPYNLRGIVNVTVLERLQKYFEQLG